MATAPRDLVSPRDPERLLALLRAHGGDAVSFQALERGMRHWFDAPPPRGTGAAVAYVDTGEAWVAAGGPIGPEAVAARAAQRFLAAARAAGRHASFFATERVLPGLSAIRVGEQPVLVPSAWLARAARSRGLREQLRRARAKGVVARTVAPHELAPGTRLRREVDALAAHWLHARRMEPMGFLVALELYVHPEEHRYLVAERAGTAIAFLSAVPIYARRGWLLEDLVRSPAAPNGTTETLLAALLREAQGADVVSLGLAPLSGAATPPWQRAAAFLGGALYDFAGLRAFKTRLHPDRWEPLYLLHPRGEPAFLPVLHGLRAFAGRPLLGFAARSLLAHPSGPPWALSLVLVLWTAVLAALAALDQAHVFGFARSTLAAWVAFDALLAVLLFRFAHRPRPQGLMLVTALAGVDAALSIAHLARAGPPPASWHLLLRLLATVGPLAGVVALGWATVLRLRLREREGW